jgi:alpha,alpha-trehalase
LPRYVRLANRDVVLGALSALCVFLAAISVTGSPYNRMRRQTSTVTKANSLEDVQKYISTGWDYLTRSLATCKTFEDIKTEGEPVLYLPAELPQPADIIELQKHCPIQIARLPVKITEPGAIDLDLIPTEGVLFLPNPYVVPGGQFNEMYGWDSYFIILGLLRENRIAMAKGMVENFFFEIEYYGAILNANRTYYLTRSQPPFLTSMILAVYNAEKSAGKADLTWLERAYRFAVTDYEEWIQPPHLAGDTGLSRYYDHGEGPVPEILGDPKHYYRGVAQYFFLHGGGDEAHLVKFDKERGAPSHVGPLLEVSECDPASKKAQDQECTILHPVALTASYYQGDRSMRESGFDVSFRFGPFSADTHHYAPVCLNSLLYKSAKDLEEMSLLLGRPEEAEKWRHLATMRREQIYKYLWNENQGLFFDYDFVTKKQSSYEYATTLYPLWADLASKEQAKAVVANLPLFEQAGGLAMSQHATGAQWDFPYGWAPIQLLAVEGLARYGYKADADRIAFNFVDMVLRDFERNKVIFEKYDVVARVSKTRIRVGYKQNEVGFGWTNGVLLELLHKLPPELADRLKSERN